MLKFSQQKEIDIAKNKLKYIKVLRVFTMKEKGEKEGGKERGRWKRREDRGTRRRKEK